MVETDEKEDTLLGFNVKGLSQLGLNEDEAVAYSILVGTGVRTAEEVSLYTGQPVNETIDALISLSEKGYARRISGIVDIYQSLNPQIVISSAAEEQLETELNRTISDINDMWKFGADLLKDTTSKFITDIKQVKNETVPNSSDDGTTLDQACGNDFEGLKQAILRAGGISPTAPGNVPETALISQIMQGIIELAQGRAINYDDIGIVNAYKLDVRANQQPPAGLFNDQLFGFNVVNSNTGASTLNLETLITGAGTVAIETYIGDAL